MTRVLTGGRWAQRHPEGGVGARKEGAAVSSRGGRPQRPFHTSVLGFCPRHWEETGVCCVSHSAWYFPCQAQETRGAGTRGGGQAGSRPAPSPSTSGPRKLPAPTFRGPQHFMSAHLRLEESVQNGAQTSPELKVERSLI